MLAALYYYQRDSRCGTGGIIKLWKRLQARRIRIESAFAGEPRRQVGDALRRFLRGRAVRRNRQEADLARTRTEDGLVVWGSGQVGGTTR